MAITERPFGWPLAPLSTPLWKLVVLQGVRGLEMKAPTNGALEVAKKKGRIETICPTVTDSTPNGCAILSNYLSVTLFSICQSLCFRHSVFVVEKCEGGTRHQYGGYADNLQTLQQNFALFGVSETIRLHPHWLTFENADEVTRLISTPEIAAFMHDADGRLDRDFHFFRPRLRSGGLIVVDDYVDERDLKQAVTFRLLNQIMEWNLFEPFHQIRGTNFGRKPANPGFKRLDLEVHRKIVGSVPKPA
jgi:hypothetical protein